MGLDITAYSRLVPAPEAERDENGYLVDSDRFCLVHAETAATNERHHPSRTAGLIHGMAYAFDDSFGFDAGSYSGYGNWRLGLAEMAGYSSPEAVWEDPTLAGPFVELIAFSDCEGMIGPVVAAKLARDFVEHQSKAEAFAASKSDYEGSYWLEKYEDWRRAFEMAADGGAVEFH